MSSRTCCFCFDLKSGTLAVGVFSLTTRALGLVIFSVLLGLAHRSSSEEAVLYADIICGAAIAECALSVLFSILLIVGVKKNKRGLFIPWMVLATLDIGSSIYFFFGCLVYITEGSVVVGKAIGSLAGIILLSYMFWCVCMYYRSLPTLNSRYQNFTNESNQMHMPPPYPDIEDVERDTKNIV